MRADHHVLDGLVDAVIASFAAWTIGYDIALVARLTRATATILSVVLVVAALAALAARRRDRQRMSVPPAQLVLVLAGGLLLATIVVFVRSANADDTFYVNRALHIVASNGPYPIRDTMFANQLYPNVLKPDLASSYEVLIGTVGWITHVDVRTLYYIVFPAIVSFLGVFTLWRLARTARTNVPIFAVAIAGIVMLLNTHPQGWGAWAVLRSFQGKGVLPFLLIPWLWHHTTSDAARGMSRWLAWMVIGTIAAVGFTSTGGFVTPLVVAGGALAVLIRREPRDLRLVGAAAIACIYPLAAAAAGGASLDVAASGIGALSTSRAWSFALGAGTDLLVLTIVALVGWALVRNRTLAYGLGLVVLMIVVLQSPPSLHILAKLGLGKQMWRILWALPLPSVAGFVADAPLARGNIGRVIAGVLGVFLVAGMYPGPRPVLGVDGHLSRRPTWDVDPDAMRAAERLVSLAHSGNVAGPEQVSELVAMSSARVYDIAPRRVYTSPLATRVRGFHGPARLALHEALRGSPITSAAFARDVRSLHVKALCVLIDAAESLQPALRTAGLRPAGQDALCTYWRR